MKLILAAEPDQVAAARAWGRPVAHLAYRVGNGPHLFRKNAPAAPQGGLMVIEDAQLQEGHSVAEFCGEVLRECAARKFTGVVCRFRERPQEVLKEAAGRLGELCPGRGLACYVTEGYGAAAPGAEVIISTAISGGTLLGRLEDAVSRFGRERVTLWVERSAEDFPLPSPGGMGAPLTWEALCRLRESQGASVFFSAELCARYFTYMAGETGHFVLFDDAGSIGKKLVLAGELGISTAFLPYGDTAELLGELLGKG